MTTNRHEPHPGIRRVFDYEHNVVFRMIRLVNLLSRNFQVVYEKDINLVVVDFRILMLIAAHPGISGSELARLSGHNQMTISNALRRLERAGRVRRETSQQDRRRAEIYLTAQGVALYNDLEPRGREMGARLRRSLTAAERRSLRRILGKLTAVIEAVELADRPAGRIPGGTTIRPGGRKNNPF